MIPPEVIVVPAVFGIPAAVLVVRMWFKHQEKMASLGRPADTASIEERLARVEQGIDAIAIEMERVGEGQRFLTNLLAQRNPALPSDQSQAKLGGSTERR